MGKDIASSSPYLDDLKDISGRVAIRSIPIEYYNTNTIENAGGDDKTIPYENETTHTLKGDFVVLARDKDNRVIPLSASMDLRRKIELWESKHIFENAEAFSFNTQVNVIYFDNDRMTVRMPTDRAFASSFKYWSVLDGNDQYYTGVMSADGTGNVITHLVEMNAFRNGAGELMSVPQVGSLIRQLDHTHNYIIKFYDASRVLVSQAVFQAIGVRNMPVNGTPESAVVDIIVTASNHATGNNEDIFKLYQGQTWKDLGLRVYLIYANGDARDVTAEWSTGMGSGRVQIFGLNDINSERISDDINKPFKFTVKYFLSQTNVDNPHVNPIDFSISHEYSVFIIPNPGDEPLTVLPVCWMEDTATSNRRLALRFLSLNKRGANKDKTMFVDITYRVKANVGTAAFANFTTVNEEDPDIIKFVTSDTGDKTVKILVPYGSGASRPYNVHLKIPQAELIPQSVALDGNIVMQGAKEFKHDFFKIISATNTPPRLYMMNETTDTTATLIEKLKQENAFAPNTYSPKILPTHIRVRAGKNATVWFAGLEKLIPLDESLFNIGFTYNMYADPIAHVSIGTPLIIEYVNYNKAENKLIVTNVKTGYVKE